MDSTWLVVNGLSIISSYETLVTFSSSFLGVKQLALDGLDGRKYNMQLSPSGKERDFSTVRNTAVANAGSSAAAQDMPSNLYIETHQVFLYV